MSGTTRPSDPVPTFEVRLHQTFTDRVDIEVYERSSHRPPSNGELAAVHRQLYETDENFLARVRKKAEELVAKVQAAHQRRAGLETGLLQLQRELNQR